MKKLGIFGGTFDPPHLGHLILAAEAEYRLGLERVLWVLTPVPPHKPDQHITSLAARQAMLELALAAHPSFAISTVEIDRPPPHFTVDTLRLLNEAHPDHAQVFLVGGDSLRDLPTWHNPSELLEVPELIGVMRRPGDVVDLSAVERALPGIAAKIRWITAPLLEISSSDIRARIASGKPYRYFLTPEVFQYIREHRMYAAQE